MAKFLVYLGAALVTLLASDVQAQNAALPDLTSSPGQVTPPVAVLPNWVGPLKGKPIDTACYRKSYITKTKQCGAGYSFDKVTTCWAQCPIEYPVECGMECLPQNEDCGREILRKVGSVATVALNAATSGVFGQLSTMSKNAQRGIKCGQQLFAAVNKIVGYIDEVEQGGKVDTTTDQLLFLISKTDFVVYDLPVAVTTCLGLPAPTGLDKTKVVVDMVKTIIDKVIASKSSGAKILSPDSFLKFATDVGLGKSLSSLSSSDQQTLKKLVATGVTCGSEIKTVVDKVVAAVTELKKQNPEGTTDAIKFAVLNSDLVLVDVPAATVGCFNANAPDGFKNRDEIIKTVHAIIDKIVETSSQNGKPVSADQFALVVANLGLDAIALFDPTGLANLAKEYIQPICGPTAYIGNIDDGPAEQALGLSTVQKAFRGSTGNWVAKGDGQLRLTFVSVDDKDVRVNVMSGGDKLYEVPVKKGQTVVWTKPLSEFRGKTLYLDRWRPGFLGLPGTGGGSFLSWVPENADGSLNLTIKINPTSFSDHARFLRRGGRGG